MRMFNNDWDLILQGEVDKPYFQALMERVDEEYRRSTVYPPRKIYFGLFSKHRTNRQKSLFWDKTLITVVGRHRD